MLARSCSHTELLYLKYLSDIIEILTKENHNNTIELFFRLTFIYMYTYSNIYIYMFWIVLRLINLRYKPGKMFYFFFLAYFLSSSFIRDFIVTRKFMWKEMVVIYSEYLLPYLINVPKLQRKLYMVFSNYSAYQLWIGDQRKQLSVQMSCVMELKIGLLKKPLIYKTIHVLVQHVRYDASFANSIVQFQIISRTSAA